MRESIMDSTARRMPGGLGLLLLVLLVVTAHPVLARGVIKIGGTGSALATMRSLGKAFAASHPGVDFEILPSIGSGGGIKAVLAGAIDLGVSARSLKDAERNAGAREIPYARTPLVFAVPITSRVESMTSDDLADIYAGRRTRWPDGTVARPILRPRTDSDSRQLQLGVPNMGAALEDAFRRRGVAIATTDQDSRDLIASVPGAVGTSTMALIMAEQPPIKPLILDGHAPMAGDMPNSAYPLFKRLYLVVGPKPEARVAEFIDFVGSGPGMAILRATGHLELAGDSP